MGNAGVTVYNSSDHPMQVYFSMFAIHHFCNSLQPGEAFTIYPGAVWFTVGAFVDYERNRISSWDVAKQVCACVFAPVLCIPVVVASVLFPILPLVPLTALMKCLATLSAHGSALGILTPMLEGAKATYASYPWLVQAIEAVGISANVGKAGKVILSELNCKLQGFETELIKRAKIHGVYCGGKHKFLEITGGPMYRDRILRNTISIRQIFRAKGGKIRYRKKNGLYNKDYEYWDPSEKLYPPKKFNKN